MTNESSRSRIALVAVGLAILPLAATAAPVDSLNVFADGEIISADAFNENFDALANAIDDNDARIVLLEDNPVSAPVGAVMFFNAAECPAGWAELEELRGRAVVGMNGSAGTLLGEVGTALEDLEAPEHGHSIPGGASVATSSASVAHTHGAGTYSTNTTGSHNHQWRDGAVTYNSAGIAAVAGIPTGIVAGGAGVAFASNADLYTANDGSHAHTISGTSGAASSTSHSHTVSLGGQSVAAVSGALPYLQLLACQQL